MNDRQKIAGFVLAGGASTRMGRPKALLEIAGVPLVLRAARLVESVTGSAMVIGGPPRPTEAPVSDSGARQGQAGSDAYQSLGLRTIEDDWEGGGPLGAIATALRVSNAPWNLVVACDLPHLTREWLEYVVGRALSSRADAVLPMNVRGAEPLCAVYHKRCEPSIRAALERGVRKVTDGLSDLRIELIERGEWKGFDSDGLLFKNVNSPEDFEEAKADLEASARRRQA